MAVENTNDSYNRCISELRARYRSRGVSSNMKQEVAQIAAAEQNEQNTAPASYVLFDSRSAMSANYRSGIYKGSKYMTSDDFVRYFKSRRAFYMPEAMKAESDVTLTTNSAVPQRKNTSGTHEMMPSEKSSKEGHLKTLVASLIELKDKWFPIEPTQGRENITRFRAPVKLMSGLAVFTLSLGLIVSGSVMIGSASGELGALNSEVARLEATQADLEGKLDLKYDIMQIKEDVSKLGMISNDYVEHKYIATEADEEVVIFEDGEDKNVGLAALLASFGIKVD